MPIKVKASLVGNLPKDIEIEVPNDKCNLRDFTEYITERLMYIARENVSIAYQEVK